MVLIVNTYPWSAKKRKCYDRQYSSVVSMRVYCLLCSHSIIKKPDFYWQNIQSWKSMVGINQDNVLLLFFQDYICIFIPHFPFFVKKIPEPESNINFSHQKWCEICEANEANLWSKAQILIDFVKAIATVSNMIVNDSKYSILTISFFNSSWPNFQPTISDSLKVSKIKLLGVIRTSDLKWEANATNLVKWVVLACGCWSLCRNIEPLQINSSEYLHILFAQFWNIQLLYGIFRTSARLKRVQKRCSNDSFEVGRNVVWRVTDKA